jgi:hypothetical protein
MLAELMLVAQLGGACGIIEDPNMPGNWLMTQPCTLDEAIYAVRDMGTLDPAIHCPTPDNRASKWPSRDYERDCQMWCGKAPPIGAVETCEGGLLPLAPSGVGVIP